MFINEHDKRRNTSFTESFPEMKDFLREATKKTGINILFEEATIFLSNTGKIEEVRNILVRKRHTQNNVFFVFHSLRSLPVETVPHRSWCGEFLD